MDLLDELIPEPVRPHMDFVKGYAAGWVSNVLDAIQPLLEADPHRFSPRPCPTCIAISAIIGRPFGCSASASARRK